MACLVVLGASAGGFALAQTASRPVPLLVEVIGAEMSSLCREADIARVRKVSEACEGKQQCRFTPEAADAAGEACTRDSVLLWRCGETGEVQRVSLAPTAGQSREIRMHCLQPILAAAPPPAIQPAAAPASATPEPEPITVTVTTPRLTQPRIQPPVRGSEAQMEAEMAAVQRYMERLGAVPHRESGIHQSLRELRAGLGQADRGLSAPLLPGERGQSASAPRPVPPARIRLVEATWGGNCRQHDGNETNRLTKACNGKAQCVFTVAARGEGEDADACAREYRMVWTCGGDPRMHAYTLPPAKGQSRQVTLVCPE